MTALKKNKACVWRGDTSRGPRYRNYRIGPHPLGGPTGRPPYPAAAAAAPLSDTNTTTAAVRLESTAPQRQPAPAGGAPAPRVPSLAEIGRLHRYHGRFLRAESERHAVETRTYNPRR